MALVLFGLCCYLGMHGHQLAWERRRFPGNVPQYLAVQRAWAVGGAVAFGVSALFCVTLGVLFMAAFRAYEARRQAASQPPPVAVSAPTGPAPLVLRPPQPAPVRRTFGDGGPRYNSPLDFQRHFNQNSRPIYRSDYRRELDPRVQPPPGYVPALQPSPPPPAAPHSGPPSGGAPEPGGPPLGMSNAPSGPQPFGQVAPPAPTPPSNPAPAPGPPGAAPNGSAGP